MCNYNTLKNDRNGYVIQCNNCNYIQVAFGTVILSLTTDQFHELVSTAGALYEEHKLHMHRDHKIIQIPTANRAVTIVLSVNELKDFLQLLIGGRNKLQYKKLFVFNEN